MVWGNKIFNLDFEEHLIHPSGKLLAHFFFYKKIEGHFLAPIGIDKLPHQKPHDPLLITPCFWIGVSSLTTFLFCRQDSRRIFSLFPSSFFCFISSFKQIRWLVVSTISAPPHFSSPDHCRRSILNFGRCESYWIQRPTNFFLWDLYMN